MTAMPTNTMPDALLRYVFAGLLVAAMVFLLGLSRAINIVNNVVPLAVVRGMQLGLGLSLVRKGVGLVQAPAAA